jgi:hypothetical protein
VATQNLQLQGAVLKIAPGGRCREVMRVQLPIKVSSAV